jgi:hypothetical protein
MHKRYYDSYAYSMDILCIEYYKYARNNIARILYERIPQFSPVEFQLCGADYRGGMPMKPSD